MPDAEGARPPRRPQYRGLCHGLSRLAARHPRPAVHPRAAAPRPVRRALPGRHQRGHRGDGAVGHAAGRAARGGQVRRHLRPLVRQRPGRRPHRRRLSPRQFRRHFAARRRPCADGRRPHRRILDHRASVRISLHRCDDPDPQPRRRAGDSRLRPLRLGDVALLRHLGGAQVDARNGGIDRRDRRQPGARQYRHPAGFRDARRRAQHPAARHHPGPGSAAARLQARCHARLRAREQAQQIHHLGRAQPEDRHHHGGQELSRRAPGARRARHR